MAGLGISTDKIAIRAWDFFPARAEFTVSNPNAEHIAVKLQAEGEGSSWISLSERSIVLAPGQSREVSLRISARRGGEFHPVIAISEQALLGEEIGVAAGIKLPVEIHSRAVTSPLLAATLILLLLITIKLFRKKRISKT